MSDLRRRMAGFTLLETLLAAVMTAVVVGASWMLFNGTYKRIVKTTSAAAALQQSLVVLERFGRDVAEMGHPHEMDRFPTRISTDGAAISFWIPKRPVDPARAGVVFRPVVWSLAPLPDGRFRALRDGKSIGGVTVTTWTFLYVEEGLVRKAERNVQLDGFARNALSESVPTSFVSTKDPRKTDPAAMVEEAEEATGSHDEEEPTTGPLSAALATSGALGHAGPFVYFRFTVRDEGGATATRAVLHDLVNVHLTVDHGYGFPLPAGASVYEGQVTTPPTQLEVAAGMRKKAREKLPPGDEVDYEALFRD